jgi:ABC-type amino acid transport system permease subunit
VELTKEATILESFYFLWEVLFIAAIFYFIICYSLSKVAKRIEIKYRIPGLGGAHE